MSNEGVLECDGSVYIHHKKHHKKFAVEMFKIKKASALGLLLIHFWKRLEIATA